jgi:putative ABC transport system permease protein
MVMGKLWSKLLRDLKQSAGQFMAFALVIAVGAFFYTGLVTLSDHLSAYSEQYFEKHNISDLNVYYSQISKQEAAALSGIPGVKKIEGRYSTQATEVFDSYKALLNIHSIPADNTINTPAVLEGSIPSKRGEVLLDSHYALEHHYRTGDGMTIRVNNQDLKFTIVGLGENVEHAKKNEIQDHQKHGFAYVAEASVPEIAGGDIHNEILVDAEDGYDVDQLARIIEEKSRNLPYVSQLSKERSFSYSQLKATIHNNGLMSKVIPLVLFLIEAIILFLTMSRMIDSQRNQVGIMKALGVKNRSIMLHYMGFPIIVSIAGSILGYVMAALVFVPMVRASNANSYSLPGIEFSLSLLSLMPPIVISSVFGMISCYLSGRKVLKERAAQMLRPKPPKTMKKIFIERISGVWSRLPYSYKLILRNIFLNKPKALASSIGVAVSTILLITAFGTQMSLQKVADQIGEVYTYDLKMDYKTGVDVGTVKLPSGIKSSYGLSTLQVNFMKDNRAEKADLIVTGAENKLIHFFDAHDNQVALENGGVLVPKSYADKYHISEGDLIQLAFTAPELRNQTVTMKVQHITNQYSNPSFFVTPEYLESFGLTYSPTSLLVAADHAAEVSHIRSFFEQDPQVEAITDQTDLGKSAEYMMQQNSFMFIMFIICAVILSFGAIYTISSINIYERNRELATLKVLGYPKNKINRLIFSENIAVTAFAVILALPASGYVFGTIVKALSSSHQQIPDQLPAAVVLIAVLLALLLTATSSLLLRRKVAGINMIESLKSVE